MKETECYRNILSLLFFLSSVWAWPPNNKLFCCVCEWKPGRRHHGVHGAENGRTFIHGIDSPVEHPGTVLADTLDATGSAAEAPKPAFPNDASYWHRTGTRPRASTAARTLTLAAAKANPARKLLRGQQCSLHHLNSHCKTDKIHWLWRAEGVIILTMLRPGKVTIPWAFRLAKTQEIAQKALLGRGLL